MEVYVTRDQHMIAALTMVLENIQDIVMVVNIVIMDYIITIMIMFGLSIHLQ